MVDLTVLLSVETHQHLILGVAVQSLDHQALWEIQVTQVECGSVSNAGTGEQVRLGSCGTISRDLTVVGRGEEIKVAPGGAKLIVASGKNRNKRSQKAQRKKKIKSKRDSRRNNESKKAPKRERSGFRKADSEVLPRWE